MTQDKKENCVQETEVQTDGRDRGEWKTIYSTGAWVQIALESLYLTLLLGAALWGVYYILSDFFYFRECFPQSKRELFTYFLYASSGLLGGVVFSIKYHYRVIGRGRWHQDRVVWRILSPAVSLVIGFLIGTMIETNFMFVPTDSTMASKIFIGFLSGYFADNAVSKMSEIAIAIFGNKRSV